MTEQTEKRGGRKRGESGAEKEREVYMREGHIGGSESAVLQSTTSQKAF